MKIGFDVSFLRLKNVGGFKSFVDYLLYGFLKNNFGNQNGFELILITSNNNHKYYLENFPYKTINLDFDNSNHFKTILSCYKFVEKSILKEDIKNLFIPAPVYPIRNNRTNKIVTIHDMRYKDLPNTFSKLQILKRIISNNSIIKNSRQIVAITNFTKVKIAEFYPNSLNKLAYIPNPVTVNTLNIDNSILSELELNKNDFYYTVSRLDDYKNLSTLIEMYKLANIKDINLKKLIVSGPSGNNSDAVKKTIAENKLSDKIILTGFISDEERNALYSNCTAFLFPSIYEGFGLPPIEAMFFGKKIIASNIPVLREVTNNEIIYINNPKDTNEWLKKIQSEKITKTYKAINIYKPEKIAKEYIGLFMKYFEE
ncbi:MAG: glycosyltransferase family 4 protein [Bacteroidales bacterium]|nr:glycosyltransferase family 4 protein [Bacteroidales bacterium]